MIQLTVDHSKHRKKSDHLKKNCSKQLNGTQLKPISIQTKQIENQFINPQQKSLELFVIPNNVSQSVQNIQSTDQSVRKTVQQLLQDYRSLAQKAYERRGKRDLEKQKQIRTQINRLRKQKIKRQNKIQKNLQMNMEKSVQIITNPGIIRDRKSIQDKLQYIQERKQQRIQKQAKFKQFYKQYRKIKPKYIEKQQQFMKREQEEQNMKDNYVKEKLKKKYEEIDINELEDFESQYKRNKQQQQYQRKQKINQNRKKQKRQKYDLKSLWKGQCHQKVEQQLKEIQNKKIQAKKKLKKMKQYATIVREEYEPRIKSSLDQSKIIALGELQIPQTQRKGRRKVIKERYERGFNRGLTITHERTPLSQQEQTKIGNSYLDYLRNLPKVKAKKESSNQAKYTIDKTPPKSPIKQVKKILNPYYNKIRKSVLDITSAQSCEQISSTFERVKNIDQEAEYQEKVVNNNQYQNIVEKQIAVQSISNRMAKNIKQKLTILNKMF